MLNASLITDLRKVMLYILVAAAANPMLSAYIILMVSDCGLLPANKFCECSIACYLYTVPLVLNFLSYKYYVEITKWNFLKVLLMVMGTINLFSIIAWILIGPFVLFIMGCDRWTID